MFCFQEEFGKTGQLYVRSLDELESRKAIFLVNKAKIDKHNAEFDRGLKSFRCGINPYSIFVSYSFYALFIYCNNNDLVILSQTFEECKVRCCGGMSEGGGGVPWYERDNLWDWLTFKFYYHFFWNFKYTVRVCMHRCVCIFNKYSQ